MGCPHIYYKRALQFFAHALVYLEDSKLAEALFTETSEEKLESFILQKKEQIEEKLFYYDAGMTFQHVLNEAYKEGCDQLNAAISGLDTFEHFIRLQEDDD